MVRLSSHDGPGKFSILDLLQRDGLASKRKSGNEWAGPCPCDSTSRDRFIVWPDRGKSGRFWCRGCSKSGDGIEYLKRFHGLSFRAALQTLGLGDSTRPPPTQLRQRKAKRTVLGNLKSQFHQWQRRKFIELTDAYLELTDEIEIARIACRALWRVPQLYTSDEHAFWTERLARLSDRRAVLEHDLDILTFSDGNMKTRFQWWRSEEGVGHE
jgi:CHC2 zinc finger